LLYERLRPVATLSWLTRLVSVVSVNVSNALSVRREVAFHKASAIKLWASKKWSSSGWRVGSPTSKLTPGVIRVMRSHSFLVLSRKTLSLNSSLTVTLGVSVMGAFRGCWRLCGSVGGRKS